MPFENVRLRQQGTCPGIPKSHTAVEVRCHHCFPFWVKHQSRNPAAIAGDSAQRQRGGQIPDHRRTVKRATDRPASGGPWQNCKPGYRACASAGKAAWQHQLWGCHTRRLLSRNRIGHGDDREQKDHRSRWTEHDPKFNSEQAFQRSGGERSPYRNQKAGPRGIRLFLKSVSAQRSRPTPSLVLPLRSRPDGSRPARHRLFRSMHRRFRASR